MNDVKWDTIGLVPLLSEMSDEEREAFVRHVEEGTLPVRYLPLEEIRRLYGQAE